MGRGLNHSRGQYEVQSTFVARVLNKPSQAKLKPSSSQSVILAGGLVLFLLGATSIYIFPQALALSATIATHSKP
jgi:hypothetical protein